MTGPVIEVADPATGELVTLPGLPALPGAGPLGLDLPPSLTWDQWSAYGATLQVAHRSIMWLLGDWLRYGEARFGERYVQAVEATGRAVQSLMNAKWVAERIPPASRRRELSWSHHADVAALTPAERDDLLTLAEAEGLRRGELRAEIERRGLRQPRATSAAAENGSQTTDAKGESGGPGKIGENYSGFIPGDLSADIAAWLAEGRRLAAEVRRGVEFVVSAENTFTDEAVELLQVLDRLANRDARRAAA